MQFQSDYFTAYHNLKLTRDDKGVLVAEFHNNGGPFIMSAQAHTELVEAFYRISQDRANKIVILTGAGGEFITDVDWSSFGDVADPGVWSQVHDEGVQVLENIANIRVPVIAAIEGRAHVHSDYALLASVIVAGEGATFQDVAHFSAGVAPGDGIFTTWSCCGLAEKAVDLCGSCVLLQLQNRLHFPRRMKCESQFRCKKGSQGDLVGSSSPATMSIARWSSDCLFQPVCEAGMHGHRASS
jgi:hypothetical protein